MIKINLLPWREIQRKEKTQVYLVQMAMSAALAAGVVFAGITYMQSQQDFQQKRNRYLQTEIAQLQQQMRDIKALESTREKLLSRMEIIQELQTKRPEIVHLFDELATTIPEGVFLTGITQSGESLTLEGRAESNSRVSAFMRNIDQSEWLKDPRLEIITADDDEQVNKFKLHLAQTQPAKKKQVN